MRINCNITIVKLLTNIELLIYKWNVCAYTLWSVLEINTGFRRHRRGIEGLRRMDLDQYSGWGNTSSPLLFGFFSWFQFSWSLQAWLSDAQDRWCWYAVSRVVWLAGCWCRLVWHLLQVTLMPIPKNWNKPKKPQFCIKVYSI